MNRAVTVWPEQTDQNVFFVISSTKLGRFWWSLVHSFLNKFAAKLCKHFLPHLNNVPTLPYLPEMLIGYVLPLSLLPKETPEFISRHLWPTNSPDFNQVYYSMWGLFKRRCTKLALVTRRTKTATENGVGQAGSRCHCSSHSSVALSIAPDKWYMFYTPSIAIFFLFPTCCY